MANDGASGSRSLMTIVTEIIGDVPRLVRKEAELLRAELGQKAEMAGDAGMGIVAGLLLLSVALLLLLQTLVLALAHVMPPWLASVTVAVLVAVVGLVMVQKGRRDLKGINPMPQRTLANLSEDAQMLKEKIK